MQVSVKSSSVRIEGADLQLYLKWAVEGGRVEDVRKCLGLGGLDVYKDVDDYDEEEDELDDDSEDEEGLDGTVSKRTGEKRKRRRLNDGGDPPLDADEGESSSDDEEEQVNNALSDPNNPPIRNNIVCRQFKDDLYTPLHTACSSTKSSAEEVRSAGRAKLG